MPGTRPPRSLPVPFALAALAALALLARPAPARAQDYSGTWRVSRDDVAVTVSDWGAPCGPRPASRQGSTGREVTVRADGGNLVLSGGRTNRTNQCWSDNRDVTLQSATHPAPNRWVVTCGTPRDFALGERGQYTLTARDANHLEFHDETAYSWSIQGTSCRASSVLTREYQRAGAAPTPQAADAAPAPVPPGVPVRPTPPRPPSRCATPGPAVSLAVTPPRRSTTAGERTCFRAHALDANRCDVAAPGLAWSAHRTAGAADGTMDRGCFVAAAASPEGEFEVTATAGALSAHATAAVVTVDRYRALVAAHLEDPDAGAEPAEAASGVQIGGALPVSHPEPAPHRSLVPWALLGMAALLALGGVALLLARRREPARPDPDARSPHPSPTPSPMPSEAPRKAPSGRPRRDAVPLTARDMPPTDRPPTVGDVDRTVVDHDAAPTFALPAAAAPVPPGTPAAPAEPPRRCPTCGTQYGGALAFCPQDGVALVSLGAGAPPATGGSAPAMVCPRCGARVTDGSRFCADDGTVLVPTGDAPGDAPAATADNTCPICRRRFPSSTVFCGEDGARLVRA